MASREEATRLRQRLITLEKHRFTGRHGKDCKIIAKKEYCHVT
jgi:hypothetical protein